MDKNTAWWLSALVALCACEEHRSFDVAVVRAALDVDYYPTLSDDLNVDGVCSLRETFRAIQTRAAVDACPAGRAGLDWNNIHLPAGTLSAALGGVDDAARSGDFDVAGNVRVYGSTSGATILDMNGLDRAFHVVNYFSLELYDLTIREGCANGGSCATDAAGSIAVGGAVYYNATGTFRLVRSRIEASSARAGGALALYNGSVTLVEDSVIAGNTAVSGGGGIDASTTWTLRDSTVERNTTTLLGATGGGVRQTDDVGTLEAATIRNNTTLGSGGGLAAVGNFQGTTAGTLVVLSSRLEGNVANVGGGNVFANASSGGVSLLNVPCASAGCLVTLTDSVVTGGIADQPAAPVFGSGGNLLANASSAVPGRIELHGSTRVSAGQDVSAPSAPDCFGIVQLFDRAEVTDVTGCTIQDQRPTGSVCGNALLEDGEECDDGNAISQDGCSSSCAVEQCLLWGSASADAGTPDAGACEPWTDTIAVPPDFRCPQEPPPDQGPFELRVALTFDDGPSVQTTPTVLAELRARSIPATFFMVGARLLDAPQSALAREIHLDPLFRVANHSYTHARLTELDLASVQDEIERTSFEIQLALEDPCYFPRFFRFPFAATTCATTLLARERGFGIAGVNVDSLDWCFAGNGTCLSPEVAPEHQSDMIAHTLARLQRAGGGIVLMHDIHARTAQLLPELLDRMVAAGVRFVHLDDASVFPQLNAAVQAPDPPACCNGVVH